MFQPTLSFKGHLPLIDRPICQGQTAISRFLRETPYGQMTYDSCALSIMIKRTKDTGIAGVLYKLKKFMGNTGKLVIKKERNDDIYIGLHKIDGIRGRNVELKGNCSVVERFIDSL